MPDKAFLSLNSGAAIFGGLEGAFTSVSFSSLETMPDPGARLLKGMQILLHVLCVLGNLTLEDNKLVKASRPA